MKLARDYTLQNINGTYYILPYGQGLTGLSQCLKVNNTEKIVFELLEQSMDPDEIVRYLIWVYDAPPTKVEPIKKEALDFLDLLRERGIILPDPVSMQSLESQNFYIGNLSIHYYGDSKFLHPSLNMFADKGTASLEEQATPSVQSWNIRPLTELNAFEGRQVFCGSDYDIYDCQKGYVVRFLSHKHLVMCMISKSGTVVNYYYDSSDSDEGIQELFYGFRIAFFYFAGQNGYFAVNSSSVLYRGKAWLFLDNSGTSHSTHAGLWHDNYDASILNGDINLVGIKNKQLQIYGTPWCGASDIYSGQTYPVGGMIVLSHTTENESSIDELSASDEALLICQHLISPCWTKEQLVSNLTFSQEVHGHGLIRRLNCATDSDAAALIKQCIDNTLSE